MKKEDRELQELDVGLKGQLLKLLILAQEPIMRRMVPIILLFILTIVLQGDVEANYSTEQAPDQGGFYSNLDSSQIHAIENYPETFIEQENPDDEYKAEIIRLNSLFDGVLRDGSLPSERVFVPDNSGLSQGELIPLMEEDRIRSLGLNTNLADQALKIFDLDYYLGDDNKQILAQGDWVDTYLEIVRMGSYGTTLLVTDAEGNFVRFVPAIHSELITQGEVSGLTKTYTEEVIQQVIYSHFVMMWQENKEAFEPFGLYSLDDVMNSLTNGTLRAFLEYIQHAMLKEADGGWIYFPYKIQVDDKPLSESVTVLNQQTDVLLQSLNTDDGEPLSYLDLLNAFANPEDFLEFNQKFYEKKGYPVWDSFGMFREGMRVVPASVDEQTELTYVMAQTEIPHHSPEQELSKQLGEIVYVRAHTAHEVFYFWKDNEGNVTRITPTINRVVQEGRVLRVKIIDETTAQILPDNGMFMPYGTANQEVFVDLVNYIQVPNFEPISVFPETTNRDKQIVVLQNQSPELLLFEGSQLILRVPVVLGDQGSTPNGQHFVSHTRASRHMPSQAGVGFVSYFGGGNALHDSPWWDWSNINTGFYGSHGCINLPDYGWNLIQVGDREMSVSEFVYSWIFSVIPTEKNAESTQISWDTPGFYDGEVAVRLLIISESKSLFSFVQQGSATMSDLAGNVDGKRGIVLPVFETAIDVSQTN